MLESTRLAYLVLALVFEKYIRFLEYLQGVAIVCTPEESPLVQFFRDVLQIIYRKDIVRPYQLLSSDNDEASLLAIGQLISASANMDALLVEANVFPRGRPYAEVYEFIHELCPDLLRADELTVALWPELNFASEPDLRRELLRSLTVELPPDGRRVVLYLAEVEHSNPLAWSLLAHEVGHVIADQLQLKRQVFQDRNLRNQSKQIEALEDWAEEILCDLVAVRALGPAYFCSLATFGIQAPEFGTDWGGAHRSHPPLHQRLQALRDHIASLLPNQTPGGPAATPNPIQPLREMVEHYHGHVGKRAELKNAPEKPIYSDVWMDLVARSIEVIEKHSDKLPCFTTEALDNSLALSEDLSRGLPIGSQLNQTLRQGVRNLLAVANSEVVDPDKKTQKLEKALAQFEEHPLAGPSIVNAAWLHRSSTLHQWADDLRAKELEPEEAFGRLWTTIRRSDQLLRKSLESSSVIRLFAQGQRLLEVEINS